MNSFKALFSPFRIKTLELKNRILIPPWESLSTACSLTRKLGNFETTVIAMGSMHSSKLLDSLEGNALKIDVVKAASKIMEVIEAVYGAEENAIKI